METQVEIDDKLTPVMAYCPAWLAERISKEAIEQRRSISSQVVLILEQHFKKPAK